MVDSNIKKVQHPTGGVVGKLFVHDGDHVKAGQMLIQLDETVTQANLAIVTKGLTELYARRRGSPPSVTAPIRSRCRRSSPTISTIPTCGGAVERAQAVRTAAPGPRRPEEAIAGAHRPVAAGDHRAHRTAGRQGQGSRADRAGTGGRPRSLAKNLVQLNRLTSLERDEAQLEGYRGQLIAQAAEAKGKIAETNCRSFRSMRICQ